MDLDVELFDYEGKQCITLGEHLFIQVKGTEQPQYGTCNIMETKVDVIKYSMEIPELNLVERVGSAFPVLLILVDVVNETEYQICLNDYIRKVLPIQNPSYKKQKTVVIYVPTANEISKSNIDALKWYGKRTKIYSMFHEMLVDIENFNYLDNDELIEYGKTFVEHYRNYDVLENGDLWSCK